jgi:hypothetical protein
MKLHAYRFPFDETGTAFSCEIAGSRRRGLARSQSANANTVDIRESLRLCAKLHRARYETEDFWAM